MCLFLSILGVSYNEDNSVFSLHDCLQHYFSLQRHVEAKSTSSHLPSLLISCEEWLQLISQSQKDFLVTSFKKVTSSKALCTACAQYISMNKTAVIPCNSLNLYPLWFYACLTNTLVSWFATLPFTVVQLHSFSLWSVQLCSQQWRINYKWL